MLEYYIGFWLTFGDIIVTAIKLACATHPILEMVIWLSSEIAIFYILQFLISLIEK